MDQASIDDPRLQAWPFWILELGPSASTTDIEQAYNRLNSLLSLGVESASTYSTPLGDKARDEFLLREARSLLTKPESRLQAEFWYVSPEPAGVTSSHVPEEKLYQILKIRPIHKKVETR